VKLRIKLIMWMSFESYALLIRTMQLLTHPAELMVSEGIVVHMSPGEGYRPTVTGASSIKASSGEQSGSSTTDGSTDSSKQEHDAVAAAEAAALLQAAWTSGIAAIATSSRTTTTTAAISGTTSSNVYSGFHSLSRWSTDAPSTVTAGVKSSDSSSTSSSSSGSSGAAKRKRRWQQALTELTVAADSSVTACNWHGIDFVHAGPGLLHINGLSNMKTRFVHVKQYN
jgi:hypothetical protein